ncbi:ABC transporter permease [Candidatus Chrysopegis kryptomonas]|uniref:ABC-2 type transport system permease protein n=1 Tax=Candidatus Chryseopegocella kryptomonas TaxID=1633643 RepID=A0A0P1MPA7_9BACT|nr:ABC transporter permease [Candidatus Chrysopegis kryptomonas]CUS97519.1 ABC-2 type transport system permease protein [Candidatus Chrysopegis kryptomonas]
MKKILTIAWWEYITKVRTKAFLISIVLMPLFIFVFSILPRVLVERADTEQKTIGVVDLTGWVFEKFEKKLLGEFKLPDGRPNYKLIKISSENFDESDINRIKKFANELVVSGKIEAYLIIPKNFEDSLSFQYIGQNVGNIKDIERFRSSLQEIVIGEKLQRYGVKKDEVAQIIKSVKYSTVKISKKGEEEKTDFIGVFFSSYIFILALMILIITGGQMLIRSVVEEKSNRVIEILLSSCTANQLMAGKIIGLGMVGLTQMFIWAIVGFYFLSGYALTSINFELLLISLIYFILGYLFYSALFVAIGAPVNSEYEAQQIAGYVSMLLVLPIAFAFLIMQNPDLYWIKILSFIPLFTPSFMVARIPIKMPAPWEIIGTILILAVSVVAMIWVAGRIFRIAILSYGKFPTFKELISWVKTK